MDGTKRKRRQAAVREISEYLTHAPQSHFHTLEEQIQTERLLTML